MGPRKRASTPSGGGQLLDGRRRHGQPLRGLRRGRHRRRAREIRQLSRPAPRLENAASQVVERFCGALRSPRLGRDARSSGRRHFRRRSPSGGERRDPTRSGCRDRRTCGRPPTSGSYERDVRRHRDPWGAPRPRARLESRETRPEKFLTELLGVVEIDADERIAALVVFDLDDFDAAIAELDARYLAGEAAAHAHTWSADLAGLRRDQPARTSATTPDWVNIDHRRGAAFAPGDADRIPPRRVGPHAETSSSTSRPCIG